MTHAAALALPLASQAQRGVLPISSALQQKRGVTDTVEFAEEPPTLLAASGHYSLGAAFWRNRAGIFSNGLPWIGPRADGNRKELQWLTETPPVPIPIEAPIEGAPTGRAPSALQQRSC